MSIVTIMIAFFVPVSVMIGLYVRVWWETVKRQRELVNLQGGRSGNGEKGRNGGRGGGGAATKNGSKRSDSRYVQGRAEKPYQVKWGKFCLG